MQQLIQILEIENPTESDIEKDANLTVPPHYKSRVNLDSMPRLNLQAPLL